jgi:predicted DNA-binding protein with PD1-like motif
MDNFSVFKGKGTVKELVLELSEDESVFECIKQGMIENKIENAKITSIEGTIKEGIINYFMGSKYKSKEIRMAKIENASGKYELKGKNFDRIFGNIHVIIAQEGIKKDPVSLTNATATEGLKIRLSFVQVSEQK